METYMETEEIYQKIFKELPVGIALCKPIVNKNGIPTDYSFIMANKAFEKHSEMKIQSTTGRTIKELFPNVEQSLIEKFGSVLINNIPTQFKSFNHNTKKHYRVNAFSLTKNKFVMAIEDITNEINFEEDIKISEENYSQLFDSMTEMLEIIEMIYDKDGRPIDWYMRQINPSLANFLGRTVAELENKRISSVINTIEEQWLNAFAIVDKTGAPTRFENYSREFHKYYAVSAWKISKNRIGVSVTEITERAKKEEKAAIELTFQNDEKEARADELVIANKALAFQNDEKESRAAELAIANKELAFQNDEKESRAAELAIANKELAFQNDEKESRAAELAIANKELAFQNDEKESRAAELVIAKDKAEESDRLKSAFLANMSHEIRTPMNGILGFADLLKSPDLTGEQQQDYIKIIEKSGVRMLNIINDIINISKIESGLMEVNISESNINEQIDYIYTFFNTEIEGKGMQFLIKNGLPFRKATIKTDREKLFAILTNLVKNAIKYSEKGIIELGYHVKDKFLEFYVKDSGIGIDNEKQEAIFERFIQADISDKRAYQGAGLGLSISKAFVEMLGGELWVESEKGKGSVFYFTIPFITESQEVGSIKNTDLNALIKDQIKNLKILVVEDDEISVYLLSIILKKIDSTVLYAVNGMEAIEISRNNPDLDLILVDVNMPVMGGYEAVAQIRKFNSDAIIFAQTANAFPGEREKAIEAGCNDYISKPVLQNELYSLIQQYYN